MGLSGWFKRMPGKQAAGTQPAPPADARRVVSLSMVKNEQDIIEPFIHHNSRFVDCMVILDNASVDQTRRIALDCARELGNVVVTDSEAFGYTQAERMTHLLQCCQAAFRADFVVPLDADEFLGAADRGALLQAFGRIAPGGAGLMPWQTFVVPPGEADAPAADPPRSMRWRRAAEQPQFHKVVLRLDGACCWDLSLLQGNHAVSASGQQVPVVPLDDVPLLHFPVRSSRQLAAKGVVGWMAYLAKDPGARGAVQGFQWRDAFDRVVSGRTGPDDVAEASLRYAQVEPHPGWDTGVVPGEPPSGYVRRHSDGAFADPLALVARSWERSLSPPPEVLQLARPAAATDGPGATATAFDAAWHWDNLFVDVAPFRFIAEKCQPASVLDIGCGIGAYLKLFKTLGASAVTGIDAVPEGAAVLEPGEYLVRDLSQPLELGRIFDLVVCVEVAEHLDAHHAGVLVGSIVRHAGSVIVFSAAEPGQPGHGHINCQPISHWLQRFAAHGWHPDLTDSLGLRALATMSWFRRNLVVLRRQKPGAGPDSAAALAAIGATPAHWYAQPPGIRHRPFLETFPEQPAQREARRP